MSFAAKQVRGLSSLASLSLFGWSVAATAQPAPKVPASQPPPAAAKAPVAPKAPTAKAPAANQPAANQPAAAKAPASQKAPSSETAPDPNAAKVTKASQVPSTDTNPTHAGSAAPPQSSTPAGGESWVPASTATAPTPSGAAGSTSHASPWPDPPDPPAPDGTGAPAYYVDQAPVPDGRSGSTAPDSRQPAEPPVDDVEPMHLRIEEPPLPPPPRHVAPRSALWLGVRVGYFIPFGDLWGRCVGSGQSACDRVEGSSFSDVAASGPMFELDVGARLGRNYTLYLGWERAQLGSADGPSPDESVAYNQLRSESDFVAVGFRLSADPDDMGMLLDLSIGTRRFRGYYEGDTELQLTQAPLESRLGVGVDIRTNRKFSLSPMLTLGIGSFGKAEWINSHYIQPAFPDSSDRLTHGWVTIQLGGHFDLAGSD